MENVSDFQKWCWKEKKHSFSNKELFFLARQLSGQKKITRNELASKMQKSLSPGSSSLPPASRQKLDSRLQEQLEKALRASRQQGQTGNRGSGQKQREAGQTSDQIAQQAGSSLFQTIAQAIIRETAGSLSKMQEHELMQDIPALQRINGLQIFIEKLEKVSKGFHLQESGAPSPCSIDTDREFSDGIPGGDKKGEDSVSLLAQSTGSVSQPADYFSRFLAQSDDKEQFNGVQTNATAKDEGHAQRRNFHKAPLPSFFETVKTILRNYTHMQKNIYRHAEPELTQNELSLMLEELIQHNVLSSTLSDTFIVNRDRTAYLLAKEAYLAMTGLFSKKHLLQRGTHRSGSRGLQEVQPDKTRPTRHLSSRIAAYPTLRRGLHRRALSPYAHLLDEEDLMEFTSTKKVGYSIAVAIDVSGAVQFGRRIQAVRKACMAFGYYIRRFHPHDRIHFIAYHETFREITFSEVPRLRAVNGAGKDIGGCLQKCRDVLHHNPDRVPVVILIGDGLPAHGDRAGFYRFMENNRDYIDKACRSARLLRKEGFLFTFLQFGEDRHLWKEYADTTAQHITREAGGVICRIDTPGDMTVSMVESFERIRTGKVLFGKHHTFGTYRH